MVQWKMCVYKWICTIMQLCGHHKISLFFVFSKPNFNFFLIIFSEFGNHYLYQIAHLGDDDDEPEFSSAMPLEEGDTFFFAPRPLRNLVKVDELESLSPILSSHIADLGKFWENFY